jgi:hypothetical protein
MKDLEIKLAKKAKELTEDMHKRLGRDPDVADYASAFEAILWGVDVAKKSKREEELHKCLSNFWALIKNGTLTPNMGQVPMIMAPHSIIAFANLLQATEKILEDSYGTNV